MCKCMRDEEWITIMDLDLSGCGGMFVPVFCVSAHSHSDHSDSVSHSSHDSGYSCGKLLITAVPQKP